MKVAKKVAIILIVIFSLIWFDLVKCAKLLRFMLIMINEGKPKYQGF